MERELFEERLREATRRVMEFTRSLVLDELPDQVLYLVRPNSSYDGTPLTGDEEVFPEDTLPEGQEFLPPTDAAGVVAFLWRHSAGGDGKVPEWVNLQVHGTTPEHTHVLLTCCGRYTAGGSLYHTRAGIPPFHLLGPPLPHDWAREEIGSPHRRTLKDLIDRYGKFRLQNQG
jgi:hypothetical protein